MKRNAWLMLIATGVGALAARGADAPAVAAKAEKIMPQPASKKGIGLAERHDMGRPQLKALNVAWYSNWGPLSELRTEIQFVPMIYSPKKLTSKISGDFVLGYNEPDNAKQADLPVKEALATWHSVAAKAKFVGGPAMAGHLLTGDWFPAFMKGKPKFDFVTVHWYKGCNAKHLIKDLEDIHAALGKPLWVTEFAPQTSAHSKQEPHKYSHTQVAEFISESTRWMDRTSYVHRYAWHDPRAGTSALFDDSGELTPTGKAYAAH